MRMCVLFLFGGGRGWGTEYTGDHTYSSVVTRHTTIDNAQNTEFLGTVRTLQTQVNVQLLLTGSTLISHNISWEN